MFAVFLFDSRAFGRDELVASFVNNADADLTLIALKETDIKLVIMKRKAVNTCEKEGQNTRKKFKLCKPAFFIVKNEYLPK